MAESGDSGAERILEQVRATGLLSAGEPVLTMLSGGRDSVCLLDVVLRIVGTGGVTALHVNYGLRGQSSEQDERHCVELCGRLGVELEVVRVEAGVGDGASQGAEGGGDAGVGEGERDGEGERAGAGGEMEAPAGGGAHAQGTEARGNLQAWARETRYRAARREARGNLQAWARETRYRAARREARGNLQAWARETRYRAARRLAERLDALIAVGHTSSDQVETILYRLAASPGRRALLGMNARDGRLVRPLLAISREQTASYCRERDLPWREDESNLSDRYARNRVRHGLLPALRDVHPAAEANVLRTAQLLREETELIDGLVEAELGGRGSIAIGRLEQLPRALARAIVIRLAEQAGRGELVPQAGDRVAELLALSRRGGRSQLHLGGGVAAVIEGGRLAMVKTPPRAG